MNSVLLSLHTYWAQVFLLPKGVLQKIVQTYRAFLWDGKAHLTKTPLLAYDWVFKPKRSGGFGIKDCLLWNMAAIGKYTWQIAKKSKHLVD